MEVLDKYGPLAVSIDASDPTFISYFSGVYGLKPSVCNSSRIGYLNLLKNNFLYWNFFDVFTEFELLKFCIFFSY